MGSTIAAPSPARRGTVPRFRHVDLWIFCRYARQDFHLSQTSVGEASMTTFDKREEGFEKQFAHDAELRFKANARRNKMLGLWAAQKLGLSGAEADEYAKAIVLVDFEEPGEDDVFRKIRKDFDEKGITDSDHQIRRTMTELMAKAVLEIKAGR